MLTGVISNAILCLIIFFIYQNIEQNQSLPSPVCLFLCETESVTVKAATLMMIIFQVGKFLSITISYLVMWKELKKSSFVTSKKR